MNDEQQIRFGMCLDENKPFAEAVLDAFYELDGIRQKERQRFTFELDKLRTENLNYKQAYFDQYYNNMEIEKCWNVIGGYNRKHLELHEALREYIRNKEWAYKVT